MPSKPKSPPKPRPKLPNGTIAKLSKALGVTARHAQTLVKAGCPVDPLEAVAWRSAQQDAGGPNTAELLRRARLKLVTEQERRIRLENDEKAAILIDVRQVDGEATHIGLAMKGALLALESTLPGGLLGLRSQGEIRGLLHKEFCKILAMLHEGEFFNGAGVLEAVRDFYPGYKPRE